MALENLGTVITLKGRRTIFRVESLDMREMGNIAKVDVAASFSQAAQSYDVYARLQKQVGLSLLNKIPQWSSLSLSGLGMDLGCGTGWLTQRLCQHLRKEMPSHSDTLPHLVALDIAPGMLAHAKSHWPQDGKDKANISWLCADAEHMPIAESSLSWIFSSLAIQWSQDIQQLFSEVHRVLKPGGWCAFSTLGPQTLQELKQAWRAVDNDIHVNQFLSEKELRDAAMINNLEVGAVDSRLDVLEYDNLRALMMELKQIGAHNLHQQRAKGMLGKSKWKTLQKAYENACLQSALSDAPCFASYEVLQFALTKPLKV